MKKIIQTDRMIQMILATSFAVASIASMITDLPSRASERIASKEQPGHSEKAVNDAQFHKRLLEIAAEYDGYGKVDDMSRWAPWLCSAPPPPRARLSKSKDPDTHGRKLYYLFAKNRNSYVENQADTTGQAIVKESWFPPATEPGKLTEADANSKEPTRIYKRDVLGPKSSLFIMFKADPKAAGTDEGWVYGTVTSDRKTVTSAGRVESCMSCHVQAPHGRLFGLQNQH